MFYHEHGSRAEILKGLQIDAPMVFILWDSNANDFEDCLLKHPLSHVTDNYYVIKNARLFDTLICNIGFHFENKLKRIEFFRDDYGNLRDSYNDIQKRFECRFGKPYKCENVLDEFENSEWNIGNKVRIYHDVIDRFGLTEYLCIERI